MKLKNITSSFLWPVVVLVVAVLVLWTKPWLAKPAQTVSVTAEGKAEAVPSIAKITASIQSTNQNLDAARAENQNKVDAIVTKLKAVGIDEKDIKTQYLSAGGGYPVPMMYPQRQTNAFTTSLEITIRKLTNADSVLAALTSNGATNIYGPQLTVDDTKLETAKSQARQNAIDAAKKKAAELAQASGQTIGKVVSIKEQGGYAYPQPIMAMGSVDLAQKESQIQPGQNDVTINLQVDFELK